MISNLRTSLVSCKFAGHLGSQSRDL